MVSKPSSPALPALVAVLACVVANAHAQEADAGYHDGAWNVRWACGAAGGGNCTARLVIEDFGGTWQHVVAGGRAKKACGSRKIPLTVQQSTRSQLAFTVFGDAVAADCPMLSVRVTPVDARTLEGTVEFGAHHSESPEAHAAPAGGPVASSPTAGAPGDATGTAIRLTRR